MLKYFTKNRYYFINFLSKKKNKMISKNSLLGMRNIDKKNRILIASQFIYNEIPIRFSKRIKELEDFPFDLSYDHEIFNLRDWYIQSAEEVLNLEYPNNFEKCEILEENVNNILNRHQTTLITIAKGIHKLKNSNNLKSYDKFLYNFCINRTKTRYLLDNYLGYFSDNEDYIGNLNLNCNINNLVKSSLVEAELITSNNLMEMPEIVIDIPDVNIIYNDSYLKYVILEILKNSIVATQENENPIINIKCFNDKNFIILKIDDNGYGINEKNLNKIWEFSYTTSEVNYKNFFENDFQLSNPIAGFGYGLPISRILLKTFNGNIKIFSQENVGTSTYLFIDLSSNWYI